MVRKEGAHWFGWFQEARDKGAVRYDVTHSYYGSDGATEIETDFQALDKDGAVLLTKPLASTYIGYHDNFPKREKEYHEETVVGAVNRAIRLAKEYKDSH